MSSAPLSGFGQGGAMRDPGSRHRTPGRGVRPRLLAAAAALLLAAGGGSLAFSAGPVLPGATGPGHGAMPSPYVGWGAVLDGLDQRRASAWRRADPTALAGVFLAGSDLLRRDRADLRAYLRRGWRVAGVRTSYRVVGARPSAGADAVVRLAVVDRLLRRPTAVSVTGGHRRLLPRDRWARHTVVLRRVGPGWRIAAIRSARSVVEGGA
jgi:hypothetical protein